MVAAKANKRIDDYPLPSGPLKVCESNRHWLADTDGNALWLGGSVLPCDLIDSDDRIFNSCVNNLANAGLNFILTSISDPQPLNSGEQASCKRLSRRIELAARRGFYVAVPVSEAAAIADSLAELDNVIWVVKSQNAANVLRSYEINRDSGKIHPIACFTDDTTNADSNICDIILIQPPDNIDNLNEIIPFPRPTIVMPSNGDKKIYLPWQALCRGMGFLANSSANDELTLATGAAAAFANRLELTQMQPDPKAHKYDFCLTHKKHSALVSLSCTKSKKISFDHPAGINGYRLEQINPLTGHAKMLPANMIESDKDKLTAEFTGIFCAISL